eukprot:scaffold121182_cov18-Tisochrysis_lutea.AAC.1
MLQAEQDPESWWTALGTAVRDTCVKLEGKQQALLSIQVNHLRLISCSSKQVPLTVMKDLGAAALAYSSPAMHASCLLYLPTWCAGALAAAKVPGESIAGFAADTTCCSVCCLDAGECDLTPCDDRHACADAQ